MQDFKAVFSNQNRHHYLNSGNTPEAENDKIYINVVKAFAILKI